MERTLQETLAIAENSENAEVIELSGDLVLLRTKDMPEFAFLMWTNRDSGTFFHLSFKMPKIHKSEAYLVTCVCCHPWSCGIQDEPETSEDGYEEWEKEKEAEFKLLLSSACQEHGITTMFVRNAKSWQESPENIQVLEADKYFDEMCELYGRQTIYSALSFIDFDESIMD